jgi:hypothetical protein
MQRKENEKEEEKKETTTKDSFFDLARDPPLPFSPLSANEYLCDNVGSARTHAQLSMQRRRVESAETQTALKKASIDRKLQSAREVLPSYERLDGPCHEPLLVHVDERLEVHGRRQRRESVEHLRVCRRREVARYRVDADQFRGRRRIDEVR